MELSWFESLLYGLISGFTEVLPISSLAHQVMFLKLAGSDFDPLLRLCSNVGSIAALIVTFLPMIMRMRRERRIARYPQKKRRRQPDPATMMEIRLVRMICICSLTVFLAYPLVYNMYERLWLLAILVAVSGFVVYIPQYLPGANKRAQTLSGLDGLIIGISGGLGIVPGFSRVGLAASAAMLRGTQRQYAADLALFTAMPALLVMVIIDAIALPAAVITGLLVLNCITAAAAAFAAAWLGIALLRFAAVRAGFSGFAYYSWGFALFSLIIYLI